MNPPINLSEPCASCGVRERAICARCDASELSQLVAIGTHVDFEAGQPILWRGDEFTSFASVVSGVAALSRTMDDGRTQVVGLVLPSDFIGGLGREYVDFDVTAVTNVTLCQFKKEPFEELLERVPHLAQRLLEMAMDELNAAREWMVLLGRKTAREKIATFLAMIARRSFQSDTDGHEFDLPLTREEIADFLGLTYETVSRQLSSMKKEGTIDFTGRRHFIIKDQEALEHTSGDSTPNSSII